MNCRWMSNNSWYASHVVGVPICIVLGDKFNNFKGDVIITIELCKEVCLAMSRNIGYL